MIDLGTIFSQLWYFLPLFIILAFIRIFFTKLGKKAKEKKSNYRKKASSKNTLKDENKYFSEQKPKYNKNKDKYRKKDSKENKDTDYFSKLKAKEDKYKKRYNQKISIDEEIELRKDIYPNNMSPDIPKKEHNYFTKLKEESNKKSKNKYNEKESIHSEPELKKDFYPNNLSPDARKKEHNYFTKLKEENEKKSKKMTFEENRKKRQKEFYKKNKEKGDELEIKTGEVYKRKGYQVTYNGLLNGLKDNGIDLICENREEILLIQCKNYNKEKTISHSMIKEFHSNAIRYIKLNNLDEKKTRLKYIVPSKKVFHNSAIRIFRDEFYNCRYEII